ncbi:hypothetical protein EYF80_053254 [Liparis tanakae]|uniref:Uncharacterized protein n=1 Tax=Liparis tanakae TaxID=230148 RepID=A0A4Z2F5Y1_9TELE|nr:hypothetical protein EYF80_053254 [Liparis tanakae]
MLSSSSGYLSLRLLAAQLRRLLLKLVSGCVFKLKQLSHYEAMEAAAVVPLTLASITSPMSWTMGASRLFFISSHRLAAKRRPERHQERRNDPLTAGGHIISNYQRGDP